MKAKTSEALVCWATEGASRTLESIAEGQKEAEGAEN